MGDGDDEASNVSCALLLGLLDVECESFCLCLRAVRQKKNDGGGGISKNERLNALRNCTSFRHDNVHFE